jgi:hypothetical protein
LGRCCGARLVPINRGTQPNGMLILEIHLGDQSPEQFALNSEADLLHVAVLDRRQA